MPMAGLALEIAGDSFSAADRHPGWPRAALARPARNVRAIADAAGVLGGGADPVRRQPDPASVRVARNRQRRPSPGHHWRPLHLGGHCCRHSLAAGVRLVAGHPVRQPDPGDRADRDRTDATRRAPESVDCQYPALGRHCHRPHRRPAGGSRL
ncbi:hypothetical protein D9M69_449330 [compost metagenome]